MSVNITLYVYKTLEFINIFFRTSVVLSAYEMLSLSTFFFFQDECSFVSLRDVERVLQVMSWFYKQSLDSELFSLMDYDSDDSESENDDDEEENELVIKAEVGYFVIKSIIKVFTTNRFK